MDKPRITHQVFYAKNFYKHSGDIIADMRQVCKLDMPDYDFSSSHQILKFMRKQYNIWLSNNPELNKINNEHKVAWEYDPIKAEIWYILIDYSCYIPMTNIKGFIDGLPRYDVIEPQYNVGIYNVMRTIFNRKMSKEELVNKAKDILNMPNVEIIDILADKMVNNFNFDKASKILEAFGENISKEELDDELWDLYSDVVGYNLEDDGTIKERNLFGRSNHFSLNVYPKFGVNSTLSIDLNLIQKRWEYCSDVDITSENFNQEYLNICDKILNMAKKDFANISDIVENNFIENQTLWEAPVHLLNSKDMETTIREVLHDYIEKPWANDTYNKFIKLDEYGCLGIQTGCFNSNIINDNGKLKVILEFNSIWETNCFENNLHNYGKLFIHEAAY